MSDFASRSPPKALSFSRSKPFNLRQTDGPVDQVLSVVARPPRAKSADNSRRECRLLAPKVSALLRVWAAASRAIGDSPSLSRLAGRTATIRYFSMAIDTETLKALVEDELACTADTRVTTQVRRLLIEPTPVLRDWDYGVKGQQFVHRDDFPLAVGAL